MEQCGQRMNITVSSWRVSRYGADHETPRSVDQLQVRETSALNGGSTLGARALDIGMRWRTWAAPGSPFRQYVVFGEPAELAAASDGQCEDQPEHCRQDQPEQPCQPPLIAQICSSSRETGDVNIQV